MLSTDTMADIKRRAEAFYRTNKSEFTKDGVDCEDVEQEALMRALQVAENEMNDDKLYIMVDNFMQEFLLESKKRNRYFNK